MSVGRYMVAASLRFVLWKQNYGKHLNRLSWGTISAVEIMDTLDSLIVFLGGIKYGIGSGAWSWWRYDAMRS